MPPVVDSFIFQFYICKANWEGSLCNELSRFYWLLDMSVGYFLEYVSQMEDPVTTRDSLTLQHLSCVSGDRQLREYTYFTALFLTT